MNGNANKIRMNENNYESANKIDNGHRNSVLTRIENKEYIINVANNNNNNDNTINLNQNPKNSSNANSNNSNANRTSSSTTNNNNKNKAVPLQNNNQRNCKIKFHNKFFTFYFIFI